MLLRNVDIGSDEHLVVDAMVQSPVLESLVHLAVTKGEGVGYRAAEELGGDVGLRVSLVLCLGVLGGLRLELAVGRQVGGVVIVGMLDLGRVGERDNNEVVVAGNIYFGDKLLIWRIFVLFLCSNCAD